MADATVTEVTFEEGYEELKGIVGRLDAEDVTVHDMCELFARGKGLEQALRKYLETQQGKLDEIEAGEDLPRFAIVAPSCPAEDARFEAPATASAEGFAPAPLRQTRTADEDIPF